MKSNKWDTLPDENTLNETIENVRSRGINVIVVENKVEALKKIKELVSSGTSIMNGSSTTLIEIGFEDYLKSGEHRWLNLHEKIFKESNPEKQGELRRELVTKAEYFLGSVNAISKNGELVACDASGSRVTAYPFAAKKVLLVSGTNKITDNLNEAMKRVREYVFPLENERAKKVYGMKSTIGKWTILENEIIPNRTTLILIKEKIGF